jgi:hypothetical protein
MPGKQQTRPTTARPNPRPLKPSTQNKPNPSSLKSLALNLLQISENQLQEERRAKVQSKIVVDSQAKAPNTERPSNRGSGEKKTVDLKVLRTIEHLQTIES